jgi:signal transduction histidine kinase
MQRLVSHELKTPLSSIASFGGMLERYQLSDEELARIAGLIRGESERLLEMVTTFLDLERIGSGRWTGERAPVDLAALARERAELLAGAAAARELTLELDGLARDGDAGDRRAQVPGDPALLARVIDNLAGNAIKYTPAGGTIRLGVRAVPNEMKAEGNAEVELTVADDGPGIPADALPRLFDRFYRVPSTTADTGSGADRPAAGSGLGLALVREICEWHGGCVGVESEAGRGSVFTVRLPALSPAPDEALDRTFDRALDRASGNEGNRA